MVENTKALEAYQEAEEAPEALTCIPMLSREDIKKEDHRADKRGAPCGGQLVSVS